MSTLPDLPTANIGIMGFWNAIDQGGVSAIDPMEVTGQFNSYTSYDNGIEGEITTILDGRSLNARVKTDGWIVVYFDRTNKFVQAVNSWQDVGAGLWEMTQSWQSYNTNASFSEFRYRINNIRQAFSNGGNMTWNESDVGVHSPQYPDATNVDLLSHQFIDVTGNGQMDLAVNQTYYCAAVSTAEWGNGSTYCEVRGTGAADTTLYSGNETTPAGAVNVLNQGYDLNETISLIINPDNAGEFFMMFFTLWE